MEPMNAEKGQRSPEGRPMIEYSRIQYRRKRAVQAAGKKYRKKRLWLSGVIAIAFLLVLWSSGTEEHVRYVPDYDKEDIGALLEQNVLEEADYELLFRQTGLARAGVDMLRAAGREQELLVLQDKLFANIPICCETNAFIPRQERVAEHSVNESSLSVSAGRTVRNVEEYYGEIPYVEDGDILITFNCHVLGWRNGHAALVVDADRRRTLEASMLGHNTSVVSMEHWGKYPSFIVLRLRGVSKETRAEIAQYALGELTGVPYHLTAGWGDWLYRGESSEVVGTQCAHLVWYAYEQFGYDLDGDGGWVVTPRDLYQSSLLEVVQVYGMPITP